MNPKIRTQIKKSIAKLLPDSARLQYLSALPKIETWRKSYDNGYPIFEDRYKMYDYLESNFIKGSKIHYLEFGVYKGDSIKCWAKIHKNNKSEFIGFDTFTGLPEGWINFTRTVQTSTFDVNGEVPNVNDSRISFVKGLFQETLDSFLHDFRLSSQLVIHNDSDLYSATLFVLTRCNEIIVPGTIIIFDEFSSVLNEFRALEDYCSSYNKKYEVLGVAKYFSQVAIRML